MSWFWWSAWCVFAAEPMPAVAFQPSFGADVGLAVGAGTQLRVGVDLAARGGPWVLRWRAEGVPASTTFAWAQLCSLSCASGADRALGSTSLAFGVGTTPRQGWRIEALGGPGWMLQRHRFGGPAVNPVWWTAGHASAYAEVAVLSPHHLGIQWRIAMDIAAARRKLAINGGQPVAVGLPPSLGVRVGLSHSRGKPPGVSELQRHAPVDVRGPPAAGSPSTRERR